MGGCVRGFLQAHSGVEDHSLTGLPTGTKSGEDLYEYAAAGAAAGERRDRRVRRDIVKGEEESGPESSSAHAVSAMGRGCSSKRCPAVPVTEAKCNPSYMVYARQRTQTVDIGAYTIRCGQCAGHQGAGRKDVTENAGNLPL